MEVNPANRREKIISLTETGKQYARELILPLFQSEEEAAAQFTEQEMTEVIRTLRLWPTHWPRFKKIALQ